MEWKNDISDEHKEQMRLLGGFSPTSNAEQRLAKGYMADDEGGTSRVYLSANDLRKLASACVEVAYWLDKRADLYGELPKPPSDV
jgi:hypothetical protein